jgi:transposase
MDKYIGIDAHASSCTVVVIGPNGRKLSEQVVETDRTALVECIRSIPKPRHLCLEEGTLSSWLYELLNPHVDELIVAGTTEKRKGTKDDRHDALALAQDLRLGAIEKNVFKAPDRFALLRQLAKSYDTMTRDVVRTQVRLKGLYLSRGISTPGKTVYSPAHRQDFTAKLAATHQPSATLLYTQLDALRLLKVDAEKQLINESHRYPISRILETCPGLGPIRVALLLPVVATPNRFRTARQFWSYSGLGIMMHSSSDWVRQDEQWVRAQVNKTRGLTRTFNHTLKYVFKGAATTVITKLPDHPLRQHYERMLKAGTKPTLAKLTLARQIAATMLAMWKHEEQYDPARHHKQQLTLA